MLPPINGDINSAVIPSVGSREFEAAFGEPLSQTLDLNTWQSGEQLLAIYDRLAKEIEDAVKQETRIREQVRQEILPRLKDRPDAPANAGYYQATLDDIETVHRGWLFSGQVEACDGTNVVFDTLPLTLTQVGVCLVSYRGDQNTWGHRLYRRDMRIAGDDPVEEMRQLLDRRQSRTGFDYDSRRDTLSSLVRRGIMTYAERAALLHRSTATWRMGHGNPIPNDLIAGSGSMELLERSVALLEELVTDLRKFVFVPSATADRALITMADALRPLEYAIVETAQARLARVRDRGQYFGQWSSFMPRFDNFIAEVGPQVVTGLYRASNFSPPQIFYAHVEYAHEAALIALADSVLMEHRGFPMLIDLADRVCRATFGLDSFNASTQLAYVDAGEPFRYLTERQTRW